jgi:DNA topoisomerase-1
MDIRFTAAMEDDLELIAEKKRKWKNLIKAFWEEFIPMVKKAEKEATVPKLKTGIKCPKCSSEVLKIWSEDNYFYGCSKYPDCDYTATTTELEFNKDDYAEDFDWDQKCPKCNAKMNIRHGRFGTFLGCSKYPECKGIVSIPKKGEQFLKPEDRPDCPAIGCDGKILMRRSRFNKTFYSCSNFPDCDVIVNNLDDLEKKYDEHHPKTAYVKKTTSGKRGQKRGYTVSKELAVIVGEEPLTRGQITKKIWEYIKKHKLQDKKNKRLIVPDKALEKVFGNKEPLDMMQLARVISKHLQ